MKKREYIRENRVELKGVLYSDPIIKTAGATQKEYARITVKTEIPNHKGEKVSYFNSLTIWNSEQINTLKEMKKNAGVSIVGRLVDKKVEQDGRKRSILDVFVIEVEAMQGAFEHVNSVEIYGRAVAAPEIKTTANNFIVGNGTLAVRNKKSKNNEGSPDFIKVSFFGEVANEAKKVAKGNWTECEAIIKNSSYKNKEGKMVYFTELIASYFAKKVWEERPAYSSSQSTQESGNQYNINYDIDDMIPEDLTDMPFM